MNHPGKLATLAVAVVAAGGLGGGIAFAQSSRHSRPAAPRPAAAEPTVPDTDSVQEGDQTAPDAPAVAHPYSARLTASVARPVVAEATTEQPGEEAESSGESEGTDQSDGPGGHQDPPGDVQHEGGSSEQ